MSNEIEIVKDEEPREFRDLLIDWEALADGLAESHAEWLPFLVFGVPNNQIAKIFNIDRSIITHAIQRNDNLAYAISQGRKIVKRQLHYLWLDQKAVAAWKGVDFFLEVDPFESDENGQSKYTPVMQKAILIEKAKMIRYIIGQLGLHVHRYEVTHDTPTPMFKGDKDLAEIVMERISFTVDRNRKDASAIIPTVLIADGKYEPVIPMEEEIDSSAPYDAEKEFHTIPGISVLKKIE